jgi:NAD(P)-dependent dehydrogenase (short-subunit alcohol dehydrogenase family)
MSETPAVAAGAAPVALVTGAAGDIGGAVAERLARQGLTVVLADHPTAAAGIARTHRRCREAAPDSQLTSAEFDVTDHADVDAAIDEVTRAVGVPGLVVNNAGYQGDFATIVDASPVELATVLAVNVGGVFAVLQAVAGRLRRQGRAGSIVNVASMAGVSGAPNMAAYSASKGAVIALTKSAAKDLAPLGIRVNAVSPGFIGPGAMWTNQVRRQAAVASPYYADDEITVAAQMISQVPLRRYGTLAEVASTVAFLLSEDASYLTGVNVEIAGGAA